MAVFIPGETIAHEFIIPFAHEDIAEVIVTYKQNNKVVLTIPITSEDRFEEHGETETRILVTFSQKESLLFDDKNDFKIQLNVLTNRGGARAASVEISSNTGIQHYKNVMKKEEVTSNEQ